MYDTLEMAILFFHDFQGPSFDVFAGSRYTPRTVGPWQYLATAFAVPTPATWTRLSGNTRVQTVTSQRRRPFSVYHGPG